MRHQAIQRHLDVRARRQANEQRILEAVRPGRRGVLESGKVFSAEAVQRTRDAHLGVRRLDAERLGQIRTRRLPDGDDAEDGRHAGLTKRPCPAGPVMAPSWNTRTPRTNVDTTRPRIRTPS